MCESVLLKSAKRKTERERKRRRDGEDINISDPLRCRSDGPKTLFFANLQSPNEKREERKKELFVDGEGENSKIRNLNGAHRQRRRRESLGGKGEGGKEL